MKIVDHTGGLVPRPGLYRMPAALYHSDPCPQPSLSSSIAKLIIEKSAHHAWCAHPRLGAVEEYERDPTRPKEIGTATHKFILGHGAEVVVIEAGDYKTADARAKRAAAYAAGHAPILKADHFTALAIAEAVRAGITLVPGCEGFLNAPAEVVAISREEDGTWIRTMMDRVEIHDTHAIIYDVKSGDQSAAPQDLGRRIENMGMEVQSNLYVRNLTNLFPHLAGRIGFRWIFVENEHPEAMSVAEADGVGLHVGSRKVDAAIHIWQRSMRTKAWAAYPRTIVEAEFPTWGEKNWTAREQLDPALAEVSYQGIGT